MDLFAIITVLFAISAIFSYATNRWTKLPGVIGVMLMAIIMAIISFIAAKSFPGLYSFISGFSASIDFSKAMLDVMLGFLLFASALHFDVQKLKENIRGVLMISTVGVLLSALIFGGSLFYIMKMLHFDLPLIYCFLFGALVSPTDAVAVAALLKKSKMPKRLEHIITGESLFNDGIGLVLFITFLELASSPDKTFSLEGAVLLFAQEVFGGLFLGALIGWIGYKMMRSINDFQTILLISISVVMIITKTALLLHVSGPLAVVAAGLLVGSRPFSDDPQVRTSEFLEKIWGIMDELLNTILFVMIGLQMVLVHITKDFFLIGIIAVFLLLMARALSIILPIVLLRRSMKLKYNNILILTWGGLRGGISVALALSLPESPYRGLILTASFIIVVFSVVVQGLTLNKVVNKLVG